MNTNETWEDRYKRAVATYAGVPADVELEDIEIQVESSDGYYYSEWTYENASFDVRVRWSDGLKVISGVDEVAGLIRSFLSPGSE